MFLLRSPVAEVPLSSLVFSHAHTHNYPESVSVHFGVWSAVTVEASGVFVLLKTTNSKTHRLDGCKNEDVVMPRCIYIPKPKWRFVTVATNCSCLSTYCIRFFRVSLV